MSNVELVKNEETVPEEVIEVVGEVVSEPSVNGSDTSSSVVPLTSASLQHFKEEDREAILTLASSVDVTKFDKVAAYGSAPLMKIFSDASAIVKGFAGTSADQEVVELVRKLAEKASKSQEDFNIVISKPNFIESLFLKLSTRLKEKNDADIKYKAISCYKLLEQLRDSCEAWIKNLEDNRVKIVQAAYSDRDTCYELEEYIVAGRIAEERLLEELETLREKWEESGLIEDKLEYENYKRGFENFKLKLVYLEKSRVANILSVGELGLQVRANENLQLTVKSQKDHSMALAIQQIRNALTDRRNREALEGQKTITKLNDELLQKVADGIALTAKESEELLLHGVYTVEAAAQAIQTVKTACADIIKAREEMVPKIELEVEKVKKLVEELSPVVDEIKSNTSIGGETLKNANLSTSTTTKSGNLTF